MSNPFNCEALAQVTAKLPSLLIAEAHMSTQGQSHDLRRRSLLIAAAALVTGAAARAEERQWVPSKPILMVVPSPAGSLPDALVRTLQPQLQAALKQPIVIENRPGAGGGLAGGYVAKALPDGYTLLFAIDTMLTINPFVYPSLAYNPVKDFKPISLLGKAGFVVVASPKIGVSTISELSRAPFARPGGLNYGSGGIGHATHFAMELIAQHIGVRMLHVPFRGTPFAIQALLGGDVDLMVSSLADTLPHIKAGKLIALGQGGPIDKSVLPNVQELRTVHPSLDMSFWLALMAPANTPAPVIAELKRAVVSAAANRESQEKIAQLGFVLTSSAPETVRDLIVGDMAKYEPLVKRLGIKLE